MSKYYNIDDLRLLAKKRVPRAVFDYADGAAEDESTKENNRESGGFPSPALILSINLFINRYTNTPLPI